MLSVGVFINGKLIWRRNAVRIKGEEGELCTYKITDMENNIVKKLKHHYNDGAVVLAREVIANEKG